MKTNSITVDEQRAIQTIVAAFKNDPAARWIYPEDKQYSRHFPNLVEIFGGRAFDAGTADEVVDGHGVALWLPPGVLPEEESLVAHLDGTVPPQRQLAMLSFLEQMGRCHPQESHWYLPLIGVIPALQGRGLGSELLRIGLQRCDQDNLPAYLEATHPRNVQLYERHGFRVMARIQAGDSPEIFPMLRQPNQTKRRK